jgi:hypothetical protein
MNGCVYDLASGVLIPLEEENKQMKSQERSRNMNMLAKASRCSTAALRRKFTFQK